MEFEGTVKKDKKTSLWIAEVSSLDAMTQGTTKENAIEMLKDLITEMLIDAFSKKVSKRFSMEIHFHGEKTFGITSCDNKVLISLALRRQREREGISIREVVNRINAKSPNAYAQYEKGDVNISVNMLDQFLSAINPNRCSRLRLV
jgi:predicted RNase H-like HicB family nuclease